jgi:hypothetical protein
MDLQTSFQVMGWVLIGICVFFLLSTIITGNIKLLITHYYSTKKAYAAALLEMQDHPGLSEKAADFWANLVMESKRQAQKTP